MKKLNHNAVILKQTRINGRIWRMELAAVPLCRRAVPGQFVMVKAGQSDDPLLRRPISIHRCNPEGIELLFEVVGAGTSLFSAMSPGDSLNLIGPLGHGFPLAAARGRTPVLIGGGIGAAPLVFLAQRLCAAGMKPAVLLGARTKDDLLCADDFRRSGCRVSVATDDGSCGRKGYVSCLLEALLKQPTTASRPVIYACGPHPMLKSIYALADTADIPAYVSLETHMACGIGACLGCIVATRQGNQRVCKDGPVFDAQDILWGQSDEN